MANGLIWLETKRCESCLFRSTWKQQACSIFIWNSWIRSLPYEKRLLQWSSRRCDWISLRNWTKIGDKHEDEHGHGHNHKHGHDKTNPHTWLSVKNAIIQLDTIYKKVSSIDPENEAYYKENLKKAQDEFRALDKKFETELSKVKSKQKYFVVSHAAFNYLANDYGLKQVAVTGISPEDEPSAKQLQKIADFVKKYKINTIFFEGKATPKVAETLAKNTNTKTDTLYTMENLTDEEIEMGYLKLMELNLKALLKSFNE